MKIKTFINVNSILLAILLVTYIYGFRNIEVNTEFVGDESIAVVVGKMGIFHADWLTLAPKIWMPGEYHLYPSISAIAYSVYGLMGVRAVSYVLSGVSFIFIYLIAFLSTLSLRIGNKVFAGLIAVALVGITHTNFLVSRLATADMLAYTLLLGGFTFLKVIEKNDYKIAQKLLTAFILFFLAFITKTFTLIFLPVILVWSVYYCINNKNKVEVLTIYFLVPLLMSLILYDYENIRYMINFQASQIPLIGIKPPVILGLLLQYTYFLAPVMLVGMFGMLLKNNTRMFFVLLTLSIIPIIYHLTTRQVVTMERHVYLTIVFLSLLGGVGTSDLISFVRSRSFTNLVKLIFTIIVVFLGYFSYLDYQLNAPLDDFYNTTNVENFIKNYSNKDTKILTEIGNPIMLALYDLNTPVNTTTLDWIKYKDSTGYEAYEKALTEKYFDLIQINGNKKVRPSERSRLIKLIKSHIINSYELVYKEKDYYVYARK